MMLLGGEGAPDGDADRDARASEPCSGADAHADLPAEYTVLTVPLLLTADGNAVADDSCSQRSRVDSIMIVFKGLAL